MLRDFFLGFVKVHILYHAAEEPVYGLWLIEELARHGYDLSPGTLYPILHSLEDDGYLVHEDRVVEGKRRKYYTITEQGREMLERARVQIRELTGEVVHGRTSPERIDLTEEDEGASSPLEQEP